MTEFKPGDVVVRKKNTNQYGDICIFSLVDGGSYNPERTSVADKIEMGEPVLFLGLREGTSDVFLVLTKRGLVGTVWGGFLGRVAKP